MDQETNKQDLPSKIKELSLEKAKIVRKINLKIVDLEYNETIKVNAYKKARIGKIMAEISHAETEKIKLSDKKLEWILGGWDKRIQHEAELLEETQKRKKEMDGSFIPPLP